MAGILNIGVSGLNAARAALNVTSQNISNVNTAGYHRKALVQSAMYPQNLGYGFPGQGVELNDVQRIYDRFLDKQVQTATAGNSYYETQFSYMKQLDDVIANSTNGISPRLQQFFSSVQTLTSDPSSIPSRQAMIDQMSSLVNTMKSADDRMEELRLGINTEVKSSVTAINGIAQQIADLNKQITMLWRNDGVQLPNDIIDQRDQAVTELNKYINATMVPLGDGTVNVYIGKGQSLVLGNDAALLKADYSTQPGMEQELVVYYQSGAPFEIPTRLLTGGSMGGALEMRETLDDTQKRIGQMAMEIVDRFNRQNAQGVDLNGDAGTDLFELRFNFPPVNPPTPDYSAKTDAEKLEIQQRYAVRALSLLQTDPNKIAAASGTTFDRKTSYQIGASGTVGIGGLPNQATYSFTAGAATTAQFSSFIDGLSTTDSINLTYSHGGTPVFTGLPPGYTVAETAPGSSSFLITNGANPTQVSFSISPALGLGNNGATLSISKPFAKTTISSVSTAAPFPEGTDVRLKFNSTDSNFTAEVAGQTWVSRRIPGVAGGFEMIEQGSGAATGLKFIVQGEPRDGEILSIKKRAPGALLDKGDNGNLLEMAKLQTLATVADLPASGKVNGIGPGTPPVLDFTINVQDPDVAADKKAQLDFVSKLPITMGFNGTNFTNLPNGYTIASSGSTYSLQDASSRTLMTFTAPAALGAANAGQTFTFPAPAASNFQATFGQMVTAVGSKTNEVKAIGAAQKVTLEQVTMARERVSGVNLDEEAANLIKFQQAYQASSKVIQIGQGLFDSVLQALR